MKQPLMMLLFALCIATVCCRGTKSLLQDGILKSSDLTAPKTFTGGVEGPAVDKAGNLYAVNFAREGTIGIITPSGQQGIFIELPNKSIGNGIRFNSNGEMLIADYTNHNILKVDMQS